MKKLVVVLVVLLGGLIYGGLNYHVIRLDKEVKVLKKVNMTLEDTYVDARGAGKLKLFTNPALAKAGIRDILSEKK